MVSSREPSVSPLDGSLNPPAPSPPPNPEDPPNPPPGLYCCCATAAEITRDRAEGANIEMWLHLGQSYLELEQISYLFSCNGFTAMKGWRWTDPILRCTNLYSSPYQTLWPYWAVLPFLVAGHQNLSRNIIFNCWPSLHYTARLSGAQKM